MPNPLPSLGKVNGALPLTFKSGAAILANAHFSQKALTKYTAELTSAARIRLVTAKLCGLQPTVVYWPDGAFAIVILDAQGSTPPSSEIVAAYRTCRLRSGIYLSKGQP